MRLLGGVLTSISMSQPRVAIYRNVGRGFEPVSLPELAYVQNARINARGNDVWITLYDYQAKTNLVLRWNGTTFERAGRQRLPAIWTVFCGFHNSSSNSYRGRVDPRLQPAGRIRQGAQQVTHFLIDLIRR